MPANEESSLRPLDQRKVGSVCGSRGPAERRKAQGRQPGGRSQSRRGAKGMRVGGRSRGRQGSPLHTRRRGWAVGQDGHQLTGKFGKQNTAPVKAKPH